MPRALINAKTANRLNTRVRGYAMTDTATYYPQPSGATGLDDFGQPTSEGEGISISCNFVDQYLASERERWVEFAEISIQLAFIRFYAPPIPEKGGRFELVKKNGIAIVEPKSFEVVGIQNRGSFGYVCALKEVQL